eukprot:TRINITY_DN86228_c0_g1_i1.p1 TRINITY_DN86228_c0_g1~~TRINITY_DN86228_c0_g1_i1.p1  ORF type:complete len:114 (-),score=27.69 TRINITY_DN86228_c0_g1_i1:55-396(-)
MQAQEIAGDESLAPEFVEDAGEVTNDESSAMTEGAGDHGDASGWATFREDDGAANVVAEAPTDGFSEVLDMSPSAVISRRLEEASGSCIAELLDEGDDLLQAKLAETLMNSCS